MLLVLFNSVFTDSLTALEFYDNKRIVKSDISSNSRMSGISDHIRQFVHQAFDKSVYGHYF
jgi:hypothetical protein